MRWSKLNFMRFCSAVSLSRVVAEPTLSAARFARKPPGGPLAGEVMDSDSAAPPHQVGCPAPRRAMPLHRGGKAVAVLGFQPRQCRVCTNSHSNLSAYTPISATKEF